MWIEDDTLIENSSEALECTHHAYCMGQTPLPATCILGERFQLLQESFWPLFAMG